MRVGRALLMVAIALHAIAASARAQTATTTVTGGPVSFPAPTGTDYAAGWIYNTGYPASGVTFTQDITKGAGNSTVTTTVSIRAATTTLGGPAGTAKPIGDLQWARVDQMAWTSLTTTNVTIDTRQMQKNRLNDTWTNTIVWRMKLGWTTDPPGTYTTGPAGIVITLSMTSP